MKKVVKKNQVVLTLLAVMIAVAGYLNYADRTKDGTVKDAANVTESGMEVGLYEISDEDILAENAALNEAVSGTSDSQGEGETGTDQTVETDASTGETAQQANASLSENQAADSGDIYSADTGEFDSAPGEAVLTNGMTVLDYVAQVQLSREQTRAKNKETLLEVINNTNITEEQKQNAVDSMMALTNIAEKENAAETLLGAKGFENSVVCINDNSADVVISRKEITDAERAQIEDIVKRKTGMEVQNIVITLLEMAE